MASKPKGKKSSNIIIHRSDTIGTGDAESDYLFQEACFVDTGAVGSLIDTENAQRIIVGRTGVGKTLLTMRLNDIEDNVIELDPSSLAMQYVSNSTMIRFAEEIGAHLDNFFLFLWLHVITVELLKRRYGIYSDATKRTMMTRLLDHVSSTKKKSMIRRAVWG